MEDIQFSELLKNQGKSCFRLCVAELPRSINISAVAGGLEDIQFSEVGIKARSSDIEGC